MLCLNFETLTLQIPHILTFIATHFTFMLRTSKQYWALPIYLADQRNYFSDLGLDVSYKTYPSGAPQITDAAENAAWDIGASGTVPCILGALEEPQIQTIGISNDESAANALVGNAEGVDLYDMLDLSSQDVTIAITPNSTGQYAVEECLRSKGQEIQWMDEHFVFGQQNDVLDNLETGDASFGSLWAPNTYSAEESIVGASILCTGKDAGATIPGGIIVRKDFGTENLATVKKVLAAWMRSIGFMLNPSNRQQSIDYLREFYAINGVVISDEALEEEFNSRPIYGLDDQVTMLNDGTIATMFHNVATFMATQGVIEAAPPTDSYIDASYMIALSNDPQLSDYAMKDDQDYAGDDIGGNEGDTGTGDEDMGDFDQNIIADCPAQIRAGIACFPACEGFRPMSLLDGSGDLPIPSNCEEAEELVCSALVGCCDQEIVDIAACAAKSNLDLDCDIVCGAGPTPTPAPTTASGGAITTPGSLGNTCSLAVVASIVLAVVNLAFT